MIEPKDGEAGYNAHSASGSAAAERVGFEEVQPFNTDPAYEAREGLWDPAQRPTRRKRALPKSRVSITLIAMIALVIVAAVTGMVF